MSTSRRIAIRATCLLASACALVLPVSNSVADTFYTVGKGGASVAHKGITVKGIEETQDGEALSYTAPPSRESKSIKLDDILRIEIDKPESGGEQTFNKAESAPHDDLQTTLEIYDTAKGDTDKGWVKQRSWLRQSALVARMRPKGDPQGSFHFFIAFAEAYPEMAGAHKPPIPEGKQELAFLVEIINRDGKDGVFDRESNDTKRVVYPYLADIYTKAGDTASARRFLTLVKALPVAKHEEPGAAAAKGSDDGFWAKTADDTKSIVFVFSADGSMINKMATLKDQIRKAVRSLKPTQSFDIICFQDVKVDPFQPKLVAATADNKAKAAQFLEGITATGTTDAIPAIKAALKLQPQVLYFVMEPDDEASTPLLDVIKQSNVGRKTTISTVLLAENKAERDKNSDSERSMKKIASDNGGEFRAIEMDKLH